MIRGSFDVVEEEDKIQASIDSFGYMSIHYICLMKPAYSGPRYNKIKSVKFEIQVRTLCMHAWAAISHYLDYKSEWDIPDHLKKGLNALSGLFYVADEQYERLFDARQSSRSAAELQASSKSVDTIQINFDTLSAFAERKFPDRESPNPSDISKVVSETIEAGFKTINDIEKAIDSVSAKFLADEESQKASQKIKRKLFYTQTGAIRVSLGLADDNYKNIKNRKVES